MGYRKIIHTYADVVDEAGNVCRGGRTLLEAGDDDGFALVDDILRMWAVCIDGTEEEIEALAAELGADYTTGDDDDE